MRKIVPENKFKRDARNRKTITELMTPEWAEVIYHLCRDIPLPQKYEDHNLTGDWLGFRECHVKPDLLLIYFKKDDDYLQLVRLGSHSELFN